MRHLKFLLGILASLLLISCAKPQSPALDPFSPIKPPEEVKTIFVFVECPRPKPPTYKNFVEEHLCGPNNAEILSANIDKKDAYVDQLLGTIQCYELQTEQVNKNVAEEE